MFGDMRAFLFISSQHSCVKYFIFWDHKVNANFPQETVHFKSINTAKQDVYESANRQISPTLNVFICVLAKRDHFLDYGFFEAYSHHSTTRYHKARLFVLCVFIFSLRLLRFYSLSFSGANLKMFPGTNGPAVRNIMQPCVSPYYTSPEGYNMLYNGFHVEPHTQLKQGESNVKSR